MDLKTKLTGGAISILVIVTIVLTAGLLGQENVYVCLEREIAMICEEGLSKVNAEGLQTRCKYFSEEKNRSTYSVCNSGWVKFEEQEPVKLNTSFSVKDFVCDDGDIVKECIAEDGTLILRIG